MTEETIELPAPSAVLLEHLENHDPINWAYGVWDEGFLIAGKTVQCHCQGAILREYALDAGVPGYEDQESLRSERYIKAVYHIPTRVLCDAINANDQIDTEDAKYLREARTQGQLYERTQKIGPKYLRRAIKIYQEAGL